MDIYLRHKSLGWGFHWNTTKYAHYITLFGLQINIRRPQ